MTKIIYDAFGLTIDVYYDKKRQQIRWSIQSDSEKTPNFSADGLKTIIGQLEKSLDFDWEVK